MGAFLGVSKGSAEKPWLLELRYDYTGEETEGQRPVVLVGKGQQSTSSCSNVMMIFFRHKEVR